MKTARSEFGHVFLFPSHWIDRGCISFSHMLSARSIVYTGHSESFDRCTSKTDSLELREGNYRSTTCTVSDFNSSMARGEVEITEDEGGNLDYMYVG